MRWQALAVTLAVSSCGVPDDTVRAEQAWFQPAQAALPFRDGQRIWWTASGRRELVTVIRDGARGYQIRSPGGRSSRVELLPILETPEEDYVLQAVTVSEDSPLYAHQFLWRQANEYVASDYLDMSRAQAMRYYRAELYPRTQNHAPSPQP